MKAILLPRAPHHREWCEPFGEGLRRHGWTVEVANDWRPCDLLVCWGVRRAVEIKAQKHHGGQVCILERGYLGDRFKWTSVSFGGGLNGRGEFRGVRQEPSRFKKNFGKSMKDWRDDEGGYALLIGQVPGDMSLAGVDIDAWYRRTAAELAARGYALRFREHPRAVERGRRVTVPGVQNSTGSLHSALSGAALVVTFNSNTGVESVLAGVPTIAADIGSMAWPVTSHAVADSPVMPDRETWAAELAWKQFSLDEITSGFCWDVVGGEP